LGEFFFGDLAAGDAVEGFGLTVGRSFGSDSEVGKVGPMEGDIDDLVGREEAGNVGFVEDEEDEDVAEDAEGRNAENPVPLEEAGEVEPGVVEPLIHFFSRELFGDAADGI
jgi:hypothetical protein